MASLHMHRFRKCFADSPARLAGRLEVEDEGKRGFKDTSSFFTWPLRFPQALEAYRICEDSVFASGGAVDELLSGHVTQKIWEYGLGLIQPLFLGGLWCC